MQELNETANKVLDAAEHYTQTLGFNAFSYKDIQNEVGIKTSSIHYYFPSKQDLALSMTDRYIERFDQLLASIAQSNTSGLQQLEELSNVYIKVLGEGKFCMCGMLASDLLALPDTVNEKLQQFFRLVEEWISEAMQLGIEQGDLRQSINAENAASHFLAALEGGMLISRTQKDAQYLKTVMSESLTQLKC
jgi:TetR/AcrR family transcriptional repressor of nem operon